MSKGSFALAGNTKKKGILRFLIYFDQRDEEFVGVCMDLSIIKCGKNPEQVKMDLVNASLGYVETVCKENLPDSLLNQKPPKIYVDIFKQFISITEGSKKYNSLSKGKKVDRIDFASTNVFVRPIDHLCLAI